MKRIISVLTATLLACTMASAQKASSQGIFVGVSASHLSDLKKSHAGVELGYDFNDHLSFGIGSDFGFPKEGYDFGAESFLRYSIVDFHHFVPFVELVCAYDSESFPLWTSSKSKCTYNYASLGIAPGLKYCFKGGVSLFCRLGAVKFVKADISEYDIRVKQHYEEFDFNLNSVQFGIAYTIPLDR